MCESTGLRVEVLTIQVQEMLQRDGRLRWTTYMSMFEPASVSTGVASSTPDVTGSVQLNIRKSISGLEGAWPVVVSITDGLIFAGPTSNTPACGGMRVGESRL